VAETVQREVAGLQLEEGLEVTHAAHPTGTDASPAMRLRRSVASSVWWAASSVWWAA
jgi:hypothetical protein